MQADAQGRRFLLELFGFLPVIIFAGVLVYISFNAPNFVTLRNLELIVMQSLPVVLVCAGLAAVVMAGGDDVVSGGIDLSIPATAVLSAGITAQMLSLGYPLLFCAAAALAASTVVGVLNALLVTRIQMTPLLTTLAMFVAVVGANNVVTASRRINVDHPWIIALRAQDVGGVPLGIVVVALVVAAAFFLLHQTRWGLNLQAAGGSRDAAEISGLNVNRFIDQSFLLAAFTGFICGFFILARGSGSSPGVQDNLMLEMVLATFLGAAFSPRRVVTMWGAVLGALLVAAISIGFKSMGVNLFWTGLIKGSLIVLVVAFSAISQRAR
ncbi:ABC transporter permease [uncultured Roseobacter sp.]|uniref:ABC transporter permease n=1 Tax=uncultured Roseobacter sp. TaxID=114847 RepID=UPI00262E32E7|nr:ABC transporter permease [uncultured Roseobacter sp.]